MHIKRLQLDVEFEDTSFHVFHTGYPIFAEEPTVIVVNGREFTGTVEYEESDDTFTITVRKTNAK